MQFSELQEFITDESARINAHFFVDASKNERLLAAMAKLTEEVGELSDEVLAACKLQRAEKLAKYSDESLGDEVTDVLISALLVAEVAGVNVEESLRRKVDKIKARSYGRPD